MVLLKKGNDVLLIEDLAEHNDRSQTRFETGIESPDFKATKAKLFLLIKMHYE